MTAYLIDSNGRRWIRSTNPPPPPPPADNKPSPVAPPFCWEVNSGDGQKPAIHYHDYDVDDRSTGLGETGEWYPAYWYDESEGRVKNPKHIVNLRGTTWAEWEYDILGSHNFSQKGDHGDGTEDTNDDSVPALLPDGSINPDKDRKQMCCVTGGAVLNIIGTFKQGGGTYDVFSTMNYYRQPEKIGDTWIYDGLAITWETHPYLFTSRVNRKMVNPENRTWISSRGVQAVSDGGADEDGNPFGAKLKEWWPNPSKALVCLPRFAQRSDGVWVNRIGYFPDLPARIHLYANSVVMDGKLVSQAGGITIDVDAYRFSGAKVFVRDSVSGKWYLAHEMAVLAGVETGWYARATDYRCYAVLETGLQTPWMGDRGYGIPDPGIWRKDM